MKLRGIVLSRSQLVRGEAILRRVGQYLFSEYTQKRGFRGPLRACNAQERGNLDEALTTVWRLKREVRASLANRPQSRDYSK